MEQELLKKFKQAKEVNIPIDVQEGVMEQILSSKKRHPFFLIFPVAVLSLIVVLTIIFPLADLQDQEQFQERPVVVEMDHPRCLPLYPSPYQYLEVLNIEKGSETL